MQNALMHYQIQLMADSIASWIIIDRTDQTSSKSSTTISITSNKRCSKAKHYKERFCAE